MLEKLGKFLRDLFVHGPKGLEHTTPTDAKAAPTDHVRVEATAPTQPETPKKQEKTATKDNVVVAPIKKQTKPATKSTATKSTATKSATEPKPKATKAKTPTTKK